MTERLPAPDISRFPTLADEHVRLLGPETIFGRIYSAGGAYALAWNDFRWYGPTASRFDHQPRPRRTHPNRGVMYLAPALPTIRGGVAPALKTCLAECFRDQGLIDTANNSPYFALLRPTRPLRLLDLADTDWITLAGGNAAISSGLRSCSREWARAIYRHYRGAEVLDGVLYTTSNLPAARSVALWERGGDALPARAAFNEQLGHLGMRRSLEKFAAELGLGLDF